MRKRAEIVFFAGLMAACFTLSGWASRPFQKAPDFSLPRLKGGPSVELSKITQNDPVLLIFWATWCPTCVEEIPALNALHKKHAFGGLRLLAVNVQESPEMLLDFIKTHPMSYPILLDQTGEVAEKYKIEGLPVSVLLAKGGEILYYGFSLPGNLDELLETRRMT